MSPKTERARAARQERAALLVAEDSETDEQIAAAVGVSKRQLERWKTEPAFAALVEQHKQDLRAAAKARSIANRDRRLDILDQHVVALEQVIAERAEAEAKIAKEDPERAIPGGTTGHVVRQYKQIGVGVLSKMVEEQAVDTGTAAEIRATLKQAAQEVGDWTEKRELTGKDGGPVALSTRVDLRSLPDDELEAIKRALTRAAGTALDPGRG